jgi:DNA-binding FrmR family transcriptional regulator
MMDETCADGRLLLKRSPAEQDALLRRWRRSEGQVRGVQQLIVDNRSCLDAVQQICATTAALRKVAVLVISDHLPAAVAAQDGDAAIQEMSTALRAARRP